MGVSQTEQLYETKRYLCVFLVFGIWMHACMQALEHLRGTQTEVLRYSNGGHTGFFFCVCWDHARRRRRLVAGCSVWGGNVFAAVGCWRATTYEVLRSE